MVVGFSPTNTRINESTSNDLAWETKVGDAVWRKVVVIVFVNRAVRSFS
jgi:hypothetical protein